MAQAVLEARSVSKSFGPIEALKSVSFSIAQGEIVALCGENGAGKSTLVKILTGIHQPTSGQICVDGTQHHFKTSADSQLTGIAFVSQELSIIPHLSVLDNLWLGHLGVPILHRGREWRDKAQAILETVGLVDVSLDRQANTLSLGQRQLLEIGRMLARKARVLLLDEPTATLSDAEIERVFQVLRNLRDAGHSIVFITHRLAEVFDVCDRVVVLRNGEMVATSTVSQCNREQLVEYMLGRSLEQMYPEHNSASVSDVALSVKNLRVPGRLHGLNFNAAPGQIVCLSGQIGSGAAEAVRALAGLVYNAKGDVYAQNQPIRLGSVVTALKANMRFVSEDRATEGIFLTQTVHVNLLATQLDRVTRHGFVKKGQAHSITKRLAEKVTLDVTRLSMLANSLSGGNQQKIAIGRLLTEQPFGVLLMNEPTRGVDVGARAEIYRLMRGVCKQGYCIVMMSTDLEEVVEVADVVITLYKGRQVAEYKTQGLSTTRVLADITHETERLEEQSS